MFEETILHGVRTWINYPPEALSLDGNITDNWARWKQHFQIFSLASGFTKKDAKVQATTLLHVYGTGALEVYNTFTWLNDEDKLKVDKIMQNFNAYCMLRKNVTWERNMFNTRNQCAGEIIDQSMLIIVKL